MTDHLLKQVEEKVVALLTEVDSLRKKLGALTEENSFLKSEHVRHAAKLQELVSLLEVLDIEPIVTPAVAEDCVA